MADKSGGSIGGNAPYRRTVKTGSLEVNGHLLQWEDVIIQISNISLITSADMARPPLPKSGIGLSVMGVMIFSSLYELTSRFSSPYRYYDSDSSGSGAFVVLVLLALAFLGIGVYLIYRWYLDYKATREYKYMHILTNSGYTYSILFENERFLQDVMDTFSGIFREGSKAETNFYIDIKHSKIIGSVVAEN